MNETEKLVKAIVEGIQEKKGKRITIVNMTKIEAICRYFVICEGTSNTQILAIEDSVKDYVKKHVDAKPFAEDGINNALWIAMDYGEVMVHIFERETRAFYDLEHLWSDAKLSDVPDME
ncbi:MAG: ribosome silencing factor [Bacteroidales bacterium]|nr:ribosome silencing factor [Bacteroidales bacterium]MDD3907706.1 ribosome silencing factor [Bacteroidales bacterium]MDD4712315.1 ribosome silencing factor [Bacteroidales bacterium]